MQQHGDHIEQLITEKLAGIIDQKDEEWLDAQISKDRAVRQLWEQACEQFNPDDIATSFSRFKNDDWRDITAEIAAAEIKQQLFTENKVRPIRPLMWAAAVIVLCVGVYLLVRNVNQSVDTTVAGKGIQLQLSGGEIIDLSHLNGNVSRQGIRFTSNGKQLSYIAYDNAVAGLNTLTISAGMDAYTVVLPDSTSVQLNAASKLQFPSRFTGATREITLNGEAYVQVKKNTNRPFIVHLPYSTVQVLGTAFNINCYDSGVVKVSLLEGAVNMQDAQKMVTLQPGKQAVYTISQASFKIQSFDEEEILGWRKGIYYFVNTSLREIGHVLERCYGVAVIIDNAGKANNTFTGIFDRKKGLPVFLDNLKTTTAINYYLDNGVLHFY